MLTQLFAPLMMMDTPIPQTELSTMAVSAMEHALFESSEPEEDHSSTTKLEWIFFKSTEEENWLSNSQSSLNNNDNVLHDTPSAIAAKNSLDQLLEDSGAFVVGEGAPECATIVAEQSMKQKTTCQQEQKTTCQQEQKTTCQQETVSKAASFSPPKPKAEVPFRRQEASFDDMKQLIIKFAKSSGMPRVDEDVAIDNKVVTGQERFQNVMTQCLNIKGVDMIASLFTWWLEDGMRLRLPRATFQPRSLLPVCLPKPRRS